MLKRLLLVLGAVIAFFFVSFIILVGPWPTYASQNLERLNSYQEAIQTLRSQLSDAVSVNPPGHLRAGWAKSEIIPPDGAPLAGYGDRKGAPAIGTHDSLYVKALALNDGEDTAVIVSSDLLIVPENIAEPVRELVSGEIGLQPGQVIFNASHTHSSVGGFAPGLLAKQFAGNYDPRIPSMLIEIFAKTIVQAVQSLEPASIALGGEVLASDYIRNRTREAHTDDASTFLVVRQADNDLCYLVRFSAHPTVLSGRNMLFSGDFPGFLQRALESETGGFAMYLGGAVGSMGPRPPDGAEDFARAHALGEALARLVLENSSELTFKDNVDIQAAGTSLRLPSFQLRISQNWRLSPFLFSLVGLDQDGWLSIIKVDNTILLGFPADFSGEIAREMRAWGKNTNDWDIWCTSFNGDYAGYVSPDKYYTTAKKYGMEGYEMYVMSWCGPDQEAFFTGICKEALSVLSSPSTTPMSN